MSEKTELQKALETPFLGLIPDNETAPQDLQEKVMATLAEMEKAGTSIPTPFIDSVLAKEETQPTEASQ